MKKIPKRVAKIIPPMTPVPTEWRLAAPVPELITRGKTPKINISDGMETYELPIWPDLYEEKGGLLEENQLLYAVLRQQSELLPTPPIGSQEPTVLCRVIR